MPGVGALFHACFFSRFFSRSSIKKEAKKILGLKNPRKKHGGVMENRTPDLRIANATLYQLSYDPTRADAADPRREGRT